jgi:CheY-like chemotaxis protein/putative methionine-R-sulfoxide reductase with GAF domain
MPIFIKFVFSVFIFSLWLYLDRIRRKYHRLELKGWVELLWGVLFLFLGSLLDLGEEFPSIAQYLTVAQTPWGLFLKTGFYLLGIILLVISPFNWLSTLFRERKESEEKEQKLSSLKNFVENINTKENLAELFAASLPKIVEYFKGDFGAIFVLSKDKNELILSSDFGFSPDTINNLRRISVRDDILSRVAKNGMAELVSDILDKEKNLASWAREDKPESCICFPLLAKGKILGLATVFSQKKFGFNKEDLEFLNFFGKELGELIRSLDDETQIREKDEELEKIKHQQDIFTQLCGKFSELTTEELLRKIVFAGVKLVNALRCEIIVLEGTEAFVRAAFDPKSSVKKFNVEENPLISEVVEKKDLVFKSQDALAKDKNSFLGVPLLVKTELLGVLILEKIDSPFTPVEIDLARSLGSYTSFVLYHQKILTKQEMEEKLWQMILSFSDERITLHNRNQKILRANQKTFKLLNLSEEEVLGKSCFELLYKSSNPESCPCYLTFQTKKPQWVQVVLDNQEASSVWTYPIMDEKGEVILVIERAQVKSKKEEKPSVSVEQINEVNNILAGILGKTQLIIKDIEEQITDPSRLVSDLRKIEKEVWEGRETINKISGISETEKVEERKKIIPEARRLKILVIDDQKMIRDLLFNILDGLGYQPRLAESGQEGLKLFLDEDFDLVITDLIMPEISGWEVSNEVKKLKFNVPVILITDWGIIPDPQVLEESGVDFVLYKPFKMEKLTEAITQAMELKRKKERSL